MKTIAYNKETFGCEELLCEVSAADKPVLLTDANGHSVVAMSLECYRSYEETTYLLRSPRNAMRLMESLTSLENRY